MKVSQTSPIDPTRRPYLAQWDTAARRNFTRFEAMKLAAADNLWQVKNSVLTSWRNPIQMRDRYTAIDTLTMRQQLGEISSTEVAEVNRVLGSATTRFSKDRKQPAKLWAWDNMTAGVLLLGGFGFCAYGLVALKSNLLWIGAAPLPALIYRQVNSSR